MTDQTQTRKTPRTPGGTFVRPISLSHQEDDIIMALMAERGIKYATAVRAIINEWAETHKTQTPG